MGGEGAGWGSRMWRLVKGKSKARHACVDSDAEVF
jgi:hypothetical protein